MLSGSTLRPLIEYLSHQVRPFLNTVPRGLVLRLFMLPPRIGHPRYASSGPIPRKSISQSYVPVSYETADACGIRPQRTPRGRELPGLHQATYPRCFPQSAEGVGEMSVPALPAVQPRQPGRPGVFPWVRS